MTSAQSCRQSNKTEQLTVSKATRSNKTSSLHVPSIKFDSQKRCYCRKAWKNCIDPNSCCSATLFSLKSEKIKNNLKKCLGGQTTGLFYFCVLEVEGETSFRDQFERPLESVLTPFLHLMEITSALFFIILSLK